MLSTPILIILFLILIVLAYLLGSYLGKKSKETYWQDQIQEQRKDAIQKSRAVIGGQFSEQLAPYLPKFQYLPTECKFIGKPIDFIVFKGMDEKNIQEVIFVEVKSGNSKLNQHEKNLKETIDNKRVTWVEYRVPEEVTKRKEF